LPQPESNSASANARPQTRRTKSPSTSGLFGLFILLLFGLLFGVSVAPALEPSTPLASYGHQAWVMENGLPQNTVQAIAQTANGSTATTSSSSIRTQNRQFPAMMCSRSWLPQTDHSGLAPPMGLHVS
jgi:hypothetical protein